MKEDRLKWILMAPAVAVLLAFFIFPLIWSLGLSFYWFRADMPWGWVNIAGRVNGEFIGLGNYDIALSDPEVWNAFHFTAKFTAIAVAIELLLGFGLAMLLYKPFRGRKLVMTLLLAPMMFAPSVVAKFFYLMYDPILGPIDFILVRLFGEAGRVQWLSDPFNAMMALVILDAWIWTPFMLLIILSGLMAVPPYLYEAARIDRATWWMKFRYITIPTIKPIIIIALIFRTLEAFKLFDTVYVLTGGGPGQSTATISFYIFLQAFRHWNTGLASATAYITLVVAIILTNLYLRYITKREVG